MVALVALWWRGVVSSRRAMVVLVALVVGRLGAGVVVIVQEPVMVSRGSAGLLSR